VQASSDRFWLWKGWGGLGEGGLGGDITQGRAQLTMAGGGALGFLHNR